MPLDGMALAALVASLQSRWLGARVTKILQPSPSVLILHLRHWRDEAALHCLLDPGAPALWVGEEDPELEVEGDNPRPHPSPFCMLLRKHLESSRWVGVEQHGWERILHLRFQHPLDGGSGRELILTLELIPRRTNALLRDGKDHRLLDALHRRHGSQGETVYRPPVSRDRIAPDGPDSLLATVIRLAPEGKSLAAHLAEQVEGMSEAAAQFALAHGGIDPRWRGSLPEEHVSRAVTAIREVASRCRQGTVQPAGLLRSPMGQGTMSNEAVAAAVQDELTDIWAFPLPAWEGKGSIVAFPDMLAACRAWGENRRLILAVEDLRRHLERCVRRHLKRLTRKQEHRLRDLQRAEASAAYKGWADLLMANLQHLPSGPLRQEEVVVTDWFAEPAASGSLPEARVPVDPQRSATENAERYYRMYRKYKEAVELITRQLQETEEEIRALEEVELALRWNPGWRELLELRDELRAGNYLENQETGKGSRPSSRRREKERESGQPFRLALADGSEIRIGRNNRQNDWLTLHWARPDDFWFHAQGIPGAHVLLRPASAGGPEADPAPEALHAAALLAAWFSRTRDSQKVPVDYTRRRYVRKPRGARPGMVIYERQRTLFVAPAPEAVEPLLAKISTGQD